MFTRVWVLSALERAGKSFVQGYAMFWVMIAGLASGPANVPNTDAFDLLFTWNNVKAGVVALALSIFTSLGSTPFGPAGSPSLTVTETEPTQPPAH